MSSNKKKSIYDGKLFYAKTSVVMPLKTTTDVLSGILNETVYYITAPDPDKPKEPAGLEIATADDSKNVFMRVNMDHDKFSKFFCKRKSYEFGICVQTLNEVLKTVEKEDTLTMYINEADKQNLVIELENDNEDIHSCYKIKLLDLNHKYKKKKKTDFDIEIVIDGSRFHKILREMKKIGDYIDIRCTSKKLEFFCTGELLERKTTLKINDGLLSVKKEDSKQKIIQGIYDINNFILFTKCATICGDINLYMKNDFALSICYTIPSYGTFSVSLTPTEEEALNNEDYGYSDNEEDIEMISNDDDKIDDSDDDIPGLSKGNDKGKKKNIIVKDDESDNSDTEDESDDEDESEEESDDE